MRHNINGPFPILSNEDSWEERIATYGNISAQVNILLVLSGRKVSEGIMQDDPGLPAPLIENKTGIYGFESITV